MKDGGAFTQVKELCQNGITNDSAKFLNFDNAITTRMIKGEIRADENDYMFVHFFIHERCILLIQRKVALFFLFSTRTAVILFREKQRSPFYSQKCNQCKKLGKCIS